MQVSAFYLVIQVLLNAALVADVIVLAIRLHKNSREHTEMREETARGYTGIYERIAELNARVEALEQSVDDALSRQKEFDITDGITGILSYDPYAVMRKGGERDGE